jgi:putative intracellular protease/amidase
MRKIIFCFLLLLQALAITAQPKKILIVSTNITTLNNAPNGTFLMEIAYPFSAFTSAGFDVDILTPKGGRASIYHNGSLNDSLTKIKGSSLFNQKTENSLSPEQIKTGDYVGIFYPGGGGQFYDVVDNKSIAFIAARIYENGGVLGSAGHGPASLINIRLSNSEFLVRNKNITCFPKAYSAKWLPFDWETILRERGAKVFIPTTDSEKDKGIELLDKENRIATGSFAENAQWVAEQMIKMLREKR